MTASATAAHGQSTGGRHGSLWRVLAIQWGIVVLAVAAWAGVTESGVVSPVLLPRVSTTAAALGHLLTSSTGLHNLAVTGLELLGAFVIATPVGIAIGFWLGEYRQRHSTFGSAADNLLSTVFSTPKFVFLPVLIVILGASYWEKVVYALADGLIVTVIGTVAAAYTAARQLRLVSRCLGMRQRQFFWKVYLPGALPILVEALRLSVILIMSGVLLAELYFANAGIGYLIFLWGTRFQLPDLFAGVILVALAAIVINTAFRVVESRLTRWQASPKV